MRRLMSVTASLVLLPWLATLPVAAAPAPVDNSEVKLTIGEAALLDLLRAATPYSLTVGGPYLSVELVFLDPSDLRLQDNRATFRIRVKGRTIPIDQVISPVVTLSYDPKINRYFGTLSSLPVQIPGVGSIDLKDAVPKVEIPSILENLWRFSDRPIGLDLEIRRLAIRDRVLDVGAGVRLRNLATPGPRSSR